MCIVKLRTTPVREGLPGVGKIDGTTKGVGESAVWAVDLTMNDHVACVEASGLDVLVVEWLES